MIPLLGDETRPAIEEAFKAGPESEAYKGVVSYRRRRHHRRCKGKVEGPRYDGGGPVFKIADVPNGGALMIELGEAAEGNWTISQYRVATKEWFDTMSREPVVTDPEYAARAPKEPVRPLQSITAQAIGALAEPYPDAAALGCR